MSSSRVKRRATRRSLSACLRARCPASGISHSGATTSLASRGSSRPSSLRRAARWLERRGGATSEAAEAEAEAEEAEAEAEAAEAAEAVVRVAPTWRGAEA